ncbi:hypothetical protein B4O85_12170 [Pseudomonas azotoformans]|uniref:Uncharacterized protein n=1 Tax=Pseudomonas azotoformans TaxID=47878 RepID=A0A4V1K0V0_PSEAZ|nr:hypothetical protein B4O85_12170 [Pseudomonas azotoformans]
MRVFACFLVAHVDSFHHTGMLYLGIGTISQSHHRYLKIRKLDMSVISQSSSSMVGSLTNIAVTVGCIAIFSACKQVSWDDSIPLLAGLALHSVIETCSYKE